MESHTIASNVAITTRGLGKQYANGNWGLRDADLTLESGKMIAVLGPNGAGKSTLIHMLAGAIRPTEGEITLSDPALRIGWSSQRTTIDWYLNTRQNIELGGRLYGLSRKDCRHRAEELMAHLQLADLAGGDVSMLSGGQQQRVQVARTLMSDPDIMLLDEPTAALDVESSEAVLTYIRDRTREGALALVSSHDLGLLERYCDEVLFTLDGRVPAHTSMHEFLHNFAPTDSLQLTLEAPITPGILSVLTPYAPEPENGDPHRVQISLPDGIALSDIVLALAGETRVLAASHRQASLRTIYLQLTRKSEGN